MVNAILKINVLTSLFMISFLSCKKTANSIYPIELESGTYEWVSSLFTNSSYERKLITPDSLQKNFSFKIENKEKFSLYENDKIVYTDKIIAIENLGQTGIMTHLTHGYAFDSYKIVLRRSEVIVSMNLYYGEFVLNNFPFINYYNSDNQSGFNDPIFFGTNLYKKM
jgi:hypothetical protein